MVLPKPIRATLKSYFFVFPLVLALFIPAVLSFLPNDSKTISMFRVSFSPQTAGHWRANRRIYPNQQASTKSAVETQFKFYPPQFSIDRILRVVQDQGPAFPPLNYHSSAVLSRVLRI